MNFEDRLDGHYMLGKAESLAWMLTLNPPKWHKERMGKELQQALKVAGRKLNSGLDLDELKKLLRKTGAFYGVYT